jgi:hypothetical protein
MGEGVVDTDDGGRRTQAPASPNKRVEYEGVRRCLENGREVKGLRGEADWAREADAGRWRSGSQVAAQI